MEIQENFSPSKVPEYLVTRVISKHLARKRFFKLFNPIIGSFRLKFVHAELKGVEIIMIQIAGKRPYEVSWSRTIHLLPVISKAVGKTELKRMSDLGSPHPT